MKTRASRTSDLSRLRMLARTARDYRETERLIKVCESQCVPHHDLDQRLERIGKEMDQHVHSAFLATQPGTPDAFAGLPD